jgi:toxin ParE1/3/4
MKVVYTQEALADLDAILEFISWHYPGVYAAFERRTQAVEARIGAWPESAPEVADRPGVRVVPLIRYPYKIFYRIENDVVEVLYVHHAARQPPWQADR